MELSILGVEVTPFRSYAEAVERVGAFVRTRDKAMAVAINPEKVYRVQREPALKAVLNGAQLKLCDGVGVALATRLLCSRRIPRVTGITLFFELMRAAEEAGWGIFLLGASEAVNASAAECLRAKHPRLRMAGRASGYFTDAGSVLDQINASGADLLFVALGSPKQEFWMSEHRDQINAPFCMGVGGTFDVISGRAKWAPAIFRRTGTEFLYRLVTEPSRWRRQKCLPLFAALVLKQWLFRLWRRDQAEAIL